MRQYPWESNSDVVEVSLIDPIIIVRSYDGNSVIEQEKRWLWAHKWSWCTYILLLEEKKKKDKRRLTDIPKALCNTTWQKLINPRHHIAHVTPWLEGAVIDRAFDVTNAYTYWRVWLGWVLYIVSCFDCLTAGLSLTFARLYPELVSINIRR